MKLDLNKLTLFRGIDRGFAEFMGRMTDHSPEFILACLLTSAATESGDTCADLKFLAEKKLSALFPDAPLARSDETENIALPQYDAWIKILSTNKGVSSAEGPPAPLILDGSGRLYLNRYYSYEQIIAEKIKSMAAIPDHAVDMDILVRGLNSFFPSNAGGPDMQRAAAVTAVLRPLCVISGGPGTGKTSTVAKILALLIEQELAAGRDFRAVLCAPTGKAAARLKESIISAVSTLELTDEVRKRIPAEAATIHRLLKGGYSRTENSGRASFPDCDCVVVDESSMMDIRIAAALLESIPERARLILLGDSHQLSSVEAGAVFASISARSEKTLFTPEFFGKIAPLCPGIDIVNRSEGVAPLRDSIIVLTKSYRFKDGEGIKTAADCVKNGDTAGLFCLLDKKDPQVKMIITDNAKSSPNELDDMIAAEYSSLFKENDLPVMLESLKEFAILCALRNGPAGVEGLNSRAEKILSNGGSIRQRHGMSEFYQGMPVMITANDYNLGLFNGDTGIVVQDSENGRFFAAFKSEESDHGLRRVPVSMLPPHEKVYAMTVHKSQGSEFNRIALVLPERESPVLTRELLYTAITRAKSSVTIFGTREVLNAGINNPTIRRSGLMDSIERG